MTLRWRKCNAHSWLGTGGKYSYHIRKHHNCFSVARGDAHSNEWFEHSLSFERATTLAEQDIIQDIIKNDEEYELEI